LELVPSAHAKKNSTIMPDRRSSPKSPETPVGFTNQPFLWQAVADGVLTSTDVTESGRLGSWVKCNDHPLLQQHNRTATATATNNYDRFLDKTIKYHPAAPARPATPPPGPTLPPPSRPPTPPKLKPISVPSMMHDPPVCCYDPRLELLKRELAAAEVYIASLERLLGSERAKNNANENVIVAFAKREIVNHKARI
jgi:hypothetical protein